MINLGTGPASSRFNNCSAGGEGVPLWRLIVNKLVGVVLSDEPSGYMKSRWPKALDMEIRQTGFGQT